MIYTFFFSKDAFLGSTQILHNCMLKIKKIPELTENNG